MEIYISLCVYMYICIYRDVDMDIDSDMALLMNWGRSFEKGFRASLKGVWG